MSTVQLTRRRFLGGASGAALLVALGACSKAESAGGSDTVRYGDVVDSKNPEVISEAFFGTKVQPAGLKVQTFPNGVLGSHERMNEQLRNGSLELTTTNVADLESYDKRLGVFAMPFAFPDRKALFEAEDGAMGKTYGGILEKYGFVVLGWFDSGLRNVYNTKRPIHEPADLKGIKIRTQGNQIMIDTFNTLGAQATPIDTTQIYSALQQGVIDGAENSTTFFVQEHHSEVAKFYSYTNHFFSIDPMLASKKWFDELKPKQKNAVMAAGKAAQDHERAMWLASDEKYTKKAQQQGVKFNDADIAAFREAVKPIYAKYGNTFGELSKYLPDL